MKSHILILSTLLLVGCGVDVSVSVDSKPTETTTKAEDVPKVSVAEGTPSGLDMGEVNPINNGYTHLDLDGDGTNDFIILQEGLNFQFAKGLGNNQYGPKKTILKLEGSIIAYNVVEVEGKVRILYWDSDKKGWYRQIVGVNNGIPYFGNVEGQ